MLDVIGPLFAWTAIFAIAAVALIAGVLGALALVHWLLPPGRIRMFIEFVLAALGLAAAIAISWQ